MTIAREQLLARAQRLGRMGYWRVDVRSGEWTWSDELTQLLGFEPSRFRPTMALLDRYLPQNERRRFRRIYAQALRKKQGRSFELAYRHADGSTRTLLIEADAELDAAGELVGFFGITQDITAHKATDTRLRLSERALNRAQDLGRSGHWFYDIASDRFEVSAGFRRIHGVPEDYEISLATILAALPRNDGEALKRHIDFAIANCAGFTFQTRAARFDGSRFDIQFDAEPDCDESGKVVRFFGITQDISEAVAAQQDLANREETLRRALTLGRMGHWYIDAVHWAIRWSNEIFVLLGLDPSSYTPTADSFVELCGEAEGQRLRSMIRQAVSGNEAFVFRTVAHSPDGRRVDVLMQGDPDFDASGQVIGFFGILQDVSGQRQLEQQLEAREAVLLRAQRIGRIGHWHLDMRSGAITWSDQIYALQGYDKNTFTPTAANTLNFYSPELSAEVARLREVSAKTGKSYSFEADMTRADTGAPLSIVVTGEPEFDSDGIVVGFFGVTQDITDRRRIENTLAQRERDMSRALTIGKMGHFHYTIATNTIEWSRELFQLHGLPTDASLSPMEAALTLYDAPTRERIRQTVQQAIANQTGYHFEASIQRPDGSAQDIAVFSEPEFTADRQLIGFFGTTQDVTEHRSAQRQLQVSENRLRATLDAIDAARVGVTTINTEGFIVDASPAILEMAGLDPEAQICGRRWSDLQGSPVFDAPAYLATIRASLAATGYWEESLIWRRLDGTDRNIFVRGVMVGEDAIQLVVFDRTEEMRILNLGQEIERTLQSTQKMEALGQLAANIAHEINNQLQPLLTFSRAAGGEGDPVRRAAHLAHVDTAARNIRDIVTRTLSFSRPASEPPQAHLADVVLADAIGFLEPLIPPSQKLNVKVAAGTARILVNRTEFTQVLVNLIRNAVDANGTSGIIALSASVEEGPSQPTMPPLPQARYLKVTVADSGAGISNAVRLRLFEPFFTTKIEGEGTGLGLAVVYGIVSRWGGGIAVESEPGKGAKFDLFLPIA
jgi:two-component system, cell cycle sensor histidine kinase and response regulator CckA